MRLVVITGQSGAGKTVALNTLEDLGWYCIDNLPAGLLETTIVHLKNTAIAEEHNGTQRQNTAVAIDARNPDSELRQAVTAIGQLRESGVEVIVVYLQAQDDILLKRYSETRRKHPLSSASLSLREAISTEMELLSPFASIADLRLDTSRLSIYDLRDHLRHRLESAAESTLSVLLMSFGFKYGVPADADFVFDVRCLPNPYWQADLRDHSGLDSEVADYLESHDEVGNMLESLSSMLKQWLPNFETGTRSYLTVAIGCTGGHHRSVYMVERLSERLADLSVPLQVRHRELKQPTK